VDLITTAELAQLVRTSEETVRYWRHVGKGPRGTKVGRRVLYERAEVQSWLRELGAQEAAGLRRNG
jgi:excisionase family DNA binding protein